MTNSDLADLEARYRSTGADADRFHWLSAKLAQGWDQELAAPIRALEEAVTAAFPSEDVEAHCRVGFATSSDDALNRLGEFSGNGSWFSVAPVGAKACLATVLDPQGMVERYTFSETFETAPVAPALEVLFPPGESVFFANFAGEGEEREVTKLARPLPGWRWHQNLALGAVRGPLVALISVNARDA